MTNPEKTQLRQILQDPRWVTAENMAKELCSMIALESKVKDTEWETLKTTLIDEGKVQGIRKFIQ